VNTTAQSPFEILGIRRNRDYNSISVQPALLQRREVMFCDIGIIEIDNHRSIFSLFFQPPVEFLSERTRLSFDAQFPTDLIEAGNGGYFLGKKKRTQCANVAHKLPPVLRESSTPKHSENEVFCSPRPVPRV
jgi:hypothetical protein